MELRVCGVYDPATINELKILGIRHFAFDLRPTSFNFIQLRKILEIIREVNTGIETFYFMFSNEKDFVVRELLKSFEQGLPRHQIRLEFFSIENLKSCNEFGVDFVWHFDKDINYLNLSELSHLKIISLSQSGLSRLSYTNQLYDFMESLDKLKNDEQSYDLYLDWNETPLDTVIDFFAIQTVSFEINQKVELSYRRIDLPLVSSHIEHTKKTLNI